jgi:hypothetical protein
MRKRVEVWMWAIPVLLASLVFWPLWLIVTVSGVVRILSGDCVSEAEGLGSGARGRC